VVLNTKTPVLDAARALENNSIGSVVVLDEGRVAGIVTDRDITIRVAGRALDPSTTLLEEVMTTPVATLSPADSQSDAIRLMQQLNVRRVPLVERERLVGIVTLDDLILDEAAPIDQLAAVVESQIGDGGPAASFRAPAMQRRTARAEATYRRLLNQVRSDAALATAEDAESALDVVLSSLLRRLTPEEAKDLISQLPSLMQPELFALPPGPDRGITRETIEADLSQRLNVDATRAMQLLTAVGATVAQSVSAGQLKDTHSQLPEELRAVFSHSAI